MKQIIVLTIAILFPVVNHCQSLKHGFGITIQGGISCLTPGYPLINPENIDSVRVYPMPTLNAGSYYHFLFRERLVFGTELFFAQISGKDRLVSHLQDSSGIWSNKATYWRNVSIFAVPVYVGYRIKRFAFMLGIRNNFALRNNVYDKGEFYEPNGNLFAAYDNSSVKFSMPLRTYSVGINGAILVNCTKNLTLEVASFIGLDNLYRKDQGTGWATDLRAYQWVIGLKYDLIPDRIGGETQHLDKLKE